jgi:hypothetical protein
MRDRVPTQAHQASMTGTGIRLSALCLAVIGLTACGGTTDKTEDPSSTSASVAATGTAAAPGSASDGGAYCDVFRDQGATLLLLHNASRETDPAKLEADFDRVVAVYQALADAAPPELRADAELLLKTYKDDREEIAQAGWQPVAVVNTLADNLRDDSYVNAAGHQMTYLTETCHIDPTKPKALPAVGG